MDVRDARFAGRQSPPYCSSERWQEARPALVARPLSQIHQLRSAGRPEAPLGNLAKAGAHCSPPTLPASRSPCAKISPCAHSLGPQPDPDIPRERVPSLSPTRGLRPPFPCLVLRPGGHEMIASGYHSVIECRLMSVQVRTQVLQVPVPLCRRRVSVCLPSGPLR